MANGSQWDSIEARRRVTAKVLVDEADIISGKIALGTLCKMLDPDNTTDWVSEAIVYINKRVDSIMGV